MWIWTNYREGDSLYYCLCFTLWSKGERYYHYGLNLIVLAFYTKMWLSETFKWKYNFTSKIGWSNYKIAAEKVNYFAVWFIIKNNF